MLILGVDTGGTFTDFIYATETGFKAYKTLSTPHNPAEAVISGIRRIAADLGLGEDIKNQGMTIVHGSTVATNAILERKGVNTALVTNTGFTDVIEIGRQNRSRLYDLAYRKPPHIVPEERRFGVPGRTTFTGDIIEPFDDDAARAVVDGIRRSGAQSVAVCFLFPFSGRNMSNAWASCLKSWASPCLCPTKSWPNLESSSGPRPPWSTPMSHRL